MKSISRKARNCKMIPFFPMLALLLMSFGNASGSESLSTQAQKAASTQKAAPAKATPAKNDDNKVYIMVDQAPQFTGGQAAMSEYFTKNFKYPKNAEAKGIQGKVYVSFVVTKEGKITKAKIWKSVDPELDAEALRLIQQMPNWVPGKKKGAIVNVALTLPVTFKLSK